MDTQRNRRPIRRKFAIALGISACPEAAMLENIELSVAGETRERIALKHAGSFPRSNDAGNRAEPPATDQEMVFDVGLLRKFGHTLSPSTLISLGDSDWHPAVSMRWRRLWPVSMAAVRRFWRIAVPPRVTRAACAMQLPGHVLARRVG